MRSLGSNAQRREFLRETDAAARPESPGTRETPPSHNGSPQNSLCGLRALYSITVKRSPFSGRRTIDSRLGNNAAAKRCAAKRIVPPNTMRKTHRANRAHPEETRKELKPWPAHHRNARQTDGRGAAPIPRIHRRARCCPNARLPRIPARTERPAPPWRQPPPCRATWRAH